MGAFLMNAQHRTGTRYLMATACAGLFTFGVMTSFLGATLPELSTRLNFDLGRGGALFSFLYFPQIPMVFLAGPLIDRFGKKPILAGGFLSAQRLWWVLLMFQVMPSWERYSSRWGWEAALP